MDNAYVVNKKNAQNQTGVVVFLAKNVAKTCLKLKKFEVEGGETITVDQKHRNKVDHNENTSLQENDHEELRDGEEQRGRRDYVRGSRLSDASILYSGQDFCFEDLLAYHQLKPSSKAYITHQAAFPKRAYFSNLRLNYYKKRHSCLSKEY